MSDCFYRCDPRPAEVKITENLIQSVTDQPVYYSFLTSDDGIHTFSFLRDGRLRTVSFGVAELQSLHRGSKMSFVSAVRLRLKALDDPHLLEAVIELDEEFPVGSIT